MYAKNIIGLMMLALIWVACKKAELPPPVTEDPVFSVTYFPDTIFEKTVTAGKDSIYLFTDYKDSGARTICLGSFADAKCPDGDCPGSLTFEFMHDQAGPFSPDTVFHLGSYSFFSLDSTAGSPIYHVTYNAVNTGNYTGFSWKIDDQNAGNGPTITADYPDISITPKFVELSAQKTTGLKSDISRSISLINPGGNLFPSLNINVLTDSTTNFLLVAETSGAPYDTLVWGTGDTSTILYQDSLMPSYSVYIADGFGNQATASFEGLTLDDVPVSTADFTYTVEQIIVPLPPGEVAIQWVDNNDIVWRSDGGVQSATAFFTVTESEPYEQNERGLKTRKMQVSFNCLLYNDSGESRNFSGSGVIAVAHP